MILEQFDLTSMNSFKVKAKARYFAEVVYEKDLEKIRHTGIFKDHPVYILGGGSNILFTRDYDGLMIHSKMKGISTNQDSNTDFVQVTAASGEPWHDLVQYCVAHNLGGIENLALIPGLCGAAPIQNIGAYGKELSDVLLWVDTVNIETGEKRRFHSEECQFGYRDSLFKQANRKIFFISSITLRLTYKNHIIDTGYAALKEQFQGVDDHALSIQDVFNVVVNVRRRKLPDPQVLGNAGSFFKNPVVNLEKFTELQKNVPTIPFYPIDNQLFKIPAAWFIEQTGWKGKRVGEVGVHHLQALVLVNLGGATGSQILELSQQIQAGVQRTFGVQLEREVNVI